MSYLQKASDSFKRWHRLYGLLGLAGLALLSGGCLNSRSLSEKEMDLLWRRNEDLAIRAVPRQLVIDDRTLPTRGIIRFEPDEEIAQREIDRAIESLKAGTDHIEFSLSPAHSQSIVNILADARMAMENLHRISQAKSRADRQLWNQHLAEALVHIEAVIRLVFQENTASAAQAARSSPGKAAEPLLLLISRYLNEDMRGELLGELTGEQQQELRHVLCQILLRSGFEVSGRQLPSNTLSETVRLMEQSRNLDDLQVSLAQYLQEAYRAATPLEEPTQLARAFGALTRWTPRLLEGLEVVLLQWPKVESVEIQILYLDEQPIFTAVINVAPREEVELARFSSVQPRLSFTGSTRVAFQLRQPYTEETVVAFESLGEKSGVLVRFEGIVYSLARLLAFPLDDGLLDEIRVYVHDPAQGDEIRHVVMLMRNPSDKHDPRRLIVFQDTRRKEWLREAFSLQKRLAWENQVFHYIRPNRHYSFTRSRQY